MGTLRRLLLRLYHVVRPAAGDAELDREIASHLALLEDQYLSRGLAPDAARTAARRALGGIAQTVDLHREARSVGWLNDLRRDLRYAARMLGRTPGFAVLVVLTLALGIGANTAIFSMVDAVMLRALPVRDPDQLVVLTWTAKHRPSTLDTSGYGDCADVKSAGFSSCSFSHPFVTHLVNANSSFTGVAAFANAGRLAVTGHGAANRARAAYVSGAYFDVLGVSAAAGRTLQIADDMSGAPAAVVLSHEYWQQALSGDPQVVGRTLSLNGQPFTVVGVADPHFTHLTPGYVYDMWIPLSSKPLVVDKWDPKSDGVDSFWIVVVARLKPNVNVSAAQAEVAGLFQQEIINAEKPLFRTGDDPRITVLPAQTALSGVRGFFSQPLDILMVVVAAVLLISCANVGGLMLARAVERQREMAVRLSLGASRARLVRQTLTESLALAAAGGVLAFALARWTNGLLVLMMSNMAGGRELALNTSVDSRVLVFALAVSGLAGILFGMAPAWRGTQVELTPALKDGRARDTGVHRRLSAGNVLAVTQVALTVVVLMGTGLLVRTLQNLRNVDPGFQTSNLLTFGVDSRIRGSGASQFLQDLQQQLARLPGVIAVSYSNDVLLARSSYGTNFRKPLDPTTDGHAEWLAVGPRFAETLGLSIRAGRDLRAQDYVDSASTGTAGVAQGREAPTPVLVNDSFVRTYLPQLDPIGQVFGGSPVRGGGWQIVGVVSDSKYDDLRKDVEPTFYRALPAARAIESSGTYFEVRTADAPAAVASSIRTIAEHADLPLFAMKTEDEQIDTLLSQERLVARLSGFFGLLALALASIGLYGLLSQGVSRRTREIGIRMALGADRVSVLRQVVGQGVSLSVVGIGVGILAGLVATRYLHTLLFGVGSGDPMTLTGVALLLVAVSLAACIIPARRATRVNPLLALRHE